MLKLTIIVATSRQLGRAERRVWKMTDERESKKKKKSSWKHEMQAEMGRSVHMELYGWMKDKASADTQRTEAVNCMVEITGGERREWGVGEGRGRWRETGTEEGYNVRTDKKRGGNEKEGKKVGLCQTEQTVRIPHSFFIIFFLEYTSYLIFPVENILLDSSMWFCSEWL